MRGRKSKIKSKFIIKQIIMELLNDATEQGDKRKTTEHVIGVPYIALADIRTDGHRTRFAKRGDRVVALVRVSLDQHREFTKGDLNPEMFSTASETIALTRPNKNDPTKKISVLVSTSALKVIREGTFTVKV